MLPEVEERMQSAVDATLRAFNSIRTGRANAAILDRVMVDYYNSPTPLKSLAGLSTPDSTTILIQPFDPSSLATIEKAISLSDVGMMPNNDGKVIRLNVPPLTSERRQEFAKLAAKCAEEGKVSVRNARRDAIDEVRKQEKNSDISEDESRDLQEQIQTLTDKYTDKIDKLLAEKEKDITTV